MNLVKWNACALIATIALAGSGCARGDRAAKAVVDEPMRLAQQSAQAAFGQGAYEEAATGFEEAIKRASLRDDGPGVARCRYQLAACRIAQGRLDEGKSLLDAARAEAVIAGDVLIVARSETAAARMALEKGDLEESQKLARQALTHPEARASVRLSADIRLVLAEGSVRGGDPVQAKAELNEAGRRWGKSPVDPAFEAVSERVRGQILLLSGDASGAGKAFDRESFRWQQISRFSDHAASLERAAWAWQKAGDGAGAANRMYRAARIREGMGHSAKVQLLAGQAAEWAQKAGLIDLHARAQALVRESGKPTAP